jgi:hypothetical protein
MDKYYGGKEAGLRISKKHESNQTSKELDQFQKSKEIGKGLDGKEVEKAVEKTLETLMRPEEQWRQNMPDRFLLENRRQRKKKTRGLGL